MDSLLLTKTDVTETARERLLRSPYMSVRSVSCEFDRGVLRLRGRVSSFYQKQVAQESVTGLSGVEQVVNEVVVAPQTVRFSWPVNADAAGCSAR